MYTAGTISGTKGSNKITGKSTQWLSNLYNILEGQVIIIYTPTSSNAYSIKNIKSNTEIELSKPLYDAFTNATYEIFTTIDNTTSDAAVKIAQSINRNNEFMAAMNKWTTGSGTVTVNWGGEQVKLTTVDQMNKNIDGKLGNSGVQSLKKGILQLHNTESSMLRLIVDEDNSNYITFYNKGSTDSVNRTAYMGFGDKNTDNLIINNSKAGKSLILNKSGLSVGGMGPVMHVGDFGVGSTIENARGNTSNTCFVSFSNVAAAVNNGWPSIGGGFQSVYAEKRRAQLLITSGLKLFFRFSLESGTDNITKWIEAYSTANTTKDANGNLKAASPIVEIYADHVVLNEESEGVELKKLHTGIYQLKGTLGMNSDPSWGGIHGGIVVPNGINGLQLVYADYDVLAVGQPHPFNGEIVPPEENGDIVVYTTYRKHSDLPQNIQRARLKTYPEFTKEVNGKIVELIAGDLVDIPNGHWIDVRVNMPSNSVYNIRQAEQEELARIAAEKAEAEEIERLEREAIEEAERIEREEIERLEREEADRVAEEAERESYESNDGDPEL